MRMFPDEAQTAQVGRGQTGSILEVLGGRGAAERAAGAERPAAECWGRPARGSVRTGRSGGGRQRIPLPRRVMRSSGN